MFKYVNSHDDKRHIVLHFLCGFRLETLLKQIFRRKTVDNAINSQQCLMYIVHALYY